MCDAMVLKHRVEQKYPHPLTARQLWMVSLCAPVNRGPKTSRTTLYPFKRLRGRLRGRGRRLAPVAQRRPDHCRVLWLLDPANPGSPWNMAPWETINHPDRAR
jgi:hypothetical protein